MTRGKRERIAPHARPPNDEGGPATALEPALPPVDPVRLPGTTTDDGCELALMGGALRCCRSHMCLEVSMLAALSTPLRAAQAPNVRPGMRASSAMDPTNTPGA